MTKTTEPVNGGGYAPLRNLQEASKALEQAIARPSMLPGIVCLYGRSGYGKSVAAAYCANRFKGVLVECRSTYTAKSLMAAICQEAGLPTARTLAGLQDQLIEELALSRRPLIVDEVDHIVEGKTLQIIRDLHDASGCAVLLIGEENLANKLKRTERFHNRVLSWVLAQPANDRDVETLIRFYCPDVEIDDALVKRMLRDCGPVIRRISINLYQFREFARAQGVKRLTESEWGRRPFFTGEPPRRDA